MIVELRDVCKTIKENIVLDKVNVKFEEGKIYGIVGINGSGKTMLMRALTGLIIPTGGRVMVNDVEMRRGDFLQNAGIMIENPEFLPNYSGFGNLKLISRIKKKVNDEEIRKVLEKVGLPEKKKYKKYSLGMKKRLGIAAAIMESPEILVLDEPFNALDTAGCGILKSILADYKEEGKTVIISSHDKMVTEEVCDEIITMENGKIIDYYNGDSDMRPNHLCEQQTIT